MRILYIAVHENNCGWGAEYFVNDGFNEIGVETSCVDYRKYRKEAGAEIYPKIMLSQQLISQ